MPRLIPSGAPGAISRRRLLGGWAALAAATLTACAEQPAHEQINLRPYWEPAIQAATGSIELLRLFEVNSRALAQQSLTPERYAFAIQELGDQVADLTERIIPLSPPLEAAEVHPYLLGAADSLVDALRSVRAFSDDSRREHLVDAIGAIGAARVNLNKFVAGVGGGQAAQGLEGMLRGLGDFDIIPTSLARYAVLVGRFDSAAEARARLGDFKDDVELSIGFPHWVEVARIDHLTDALKEEAQWRDRQFETRVDEIQDVAFRLEIRQLPAVASWKELIWLQKLSFDPTSLAAAADGSLFAVAGRNGQVWAIAGAGQNRWSTEAGIPTSSVEVSPEGSRVAVFGFDIVLLGENGQPVWQRPFRPDNQLLEEARVGPDGFLVVRSANESEIGHVFAYTPEGLLWGPTQDYVGAASLDFHPEAGLVAVGSVKGGVNQVLLIERGGDLAQRFGIEGRIQKILLSRDAAHTVVQSESGLAVYDNERGDFLTDVPFAAALMARGVDDDTLYLTSARGLAAYSLRGVQLWFNDKVAPRSLMTSRNFVCGISSDTSVSVVRTNGDYVGEATTLTSIRAVSLAPASDVLAIASAERNVVAWQLPA